MTHNSTSVLVRGVKEKSVTKNMSLKRQAVDDQNPAAQKRTLSLARDKAPTPKHISFAVRVIQYEAKIKKATREAEKCQLACDQLGTDENHRALLIATTDLDAARIHHDTMYIKWSREVVLWMQSKEFVPKKHNVLHCGGMTPDVMHLSIPPTQCYVTSNALREYGRLKGRQRPYRAKRAQYTRFEVTRKNPAHNACIVTQTSTSGKYWSTPEPLQGVYIPCTWYNWIDGNREATKSMLYYPTSPFVLLPSDLKRVIICMVRDCN